MKEQSILDAFTDGKEIDVPTIIGTNSDEGRLYGTQRVATLGEDGAPIFQYFFDYVATARRPDNPNGVPHAGELPFVFDTLQTDRRTAGMVAPEDQKVADLCPLLLGRLRQAANRQQNDYLRQRL